MALRRGWGPVDARFAGRAPLRIAETLTFVAALRHDGLTAPRVPDGPIDGAAFRLYVA